MSTALAKPRVRVRTDGVMVLGDGFANVITALGAANPKTAANRYLVNYSQADLEAAYRTSTWFGKIVDIPADDATREWRAWNADKGQIELIEKEEGRLQVRQKVRQAMIWARLYGGAAIIPVGLPGLPETPLRLDSVRTGSITSLSILHRHEISAHGLIRDPLSPLNGEPEEYTVNTDRGQVRFHPSRIIRISGREIPGHRVGNDIWGDSVWMHLEDAVRSSDAGAAIIAALMQEAKTDVIRQPNLMAGMATAEYEATLIRRYTMTAMLRSIANVTLLDKEDEWDQKQIAWAGLPDVMNILLTIMAGAADIPVTRLLGKSVSGLAASDEVSLKNYYDNVKAKQELVLSPMLRPLDEMLIRSALGNRPDEVWHSWRSLFQLSDKEKAEVDKVEAEASNIYATTGMIPADALAQSVQNRMIESGRWPGLEQGLEESKLALDLPDPEDDEDDDGSVVPLRQAANDAAPRTLYVRRDVLNATEIIAHFKAQGFSTTLPADDMHVTIAFSRQEVDWMKVGDTWQSEIEIAAGGPRMMEAFGQNGEAKVMLFASSELSWRHEEIKRAGASWDHPEYQPHITISYADDAPAISSVEPYRGKIVLGPEIFETVKEDWKASITEDAQ